MLQTKHKRENQSGHQVKKRNLRHYLKFLNVFHHLHIYVILNRNKRMLRLRRKSVEKRNSRGDIVRKEEVVTLTKKLHASNKAQERKPEWPPSKGVPLSNPHRQCLPQGGSTKPNVKYSDTEGSNAEGSEVEDEEGSDAEDTNSKESEAEDNNSDESEDNNSEESEVDEETNSEESEAEDNNSEKSGTEDINSEESSEAEEDSDDEPPRRLIDLPNPSTRRRLIDMPNPSTRRNKRMLRLRRKSVEKRNSRGDIVRKEEVVTLTKKLHASNKAQERKPDWKPTTTGRPYEFLPPYQGVLLSNAHRQFPPQGNNFVERMSHNSRQGVLLSNLPRQFPPQGRQLEYINEQDLGGFSKTNAKNFEAKVSNAEDSSDAEDVEGSDAEDTNSEECEVDDTNSEKSEDDDTNSEKSEDDDTNSEESQDENSNYEESETEDINSEESEAEDINSEESEAEDINSEEYETEDINSEESEAEDINSEESSEEYEDSDNEPPRFVHMFTTT
ncbi:hypothetical protein DEO72_LG1g1577 [Vigna unguiculata]|uniref:Uncharacterized protein n=1 Tax=Vigna unguiculata TaxID=3917 RepID=A0A4D6KS41_VIGUN|nr:hypothetical protein DEO72_LG1g1577 [Vigna unguiculata]